MGGDSADKGFNPSSALVKAVLINSAKPTATLLDSYGEPFPLSGVHTNVPDNCQVPHTPATPTHESGAPDAFYRLP
jgi:hypothetical protein